MTDLDAIYDIPTTTPSTRPRRPGIWRAVSMIAVVAALFVSTLSILQSRDASNVPERDRASLTLQEANVTVSDLVIPADAQVAVLGLADADSRQPFDADGVSIDVPENEAALIAMTDRDGSIVGLAVSTASDTNRDVTLSVQSTASALLFLSPGILRSDIDATIANVAVIESDPAFEKLVAAVAADSNISRSNPSLEQAIAEIADRTPVQRREPDQGCDSVFASNAYPSAGTCVQPKETGIVITNEQDRWALIYSGTPGFTELCATISPTGIEGSEVLLPSEQCEGDSLMVAPGPVVNQGGDQPTIDDRIRTATAVNELYEYAGPFAEIAGGSAGFTAGSVQHIRRNAADIATTLARMVATDPEFSEAMDVPRTSSTALDRHAASIIAARAIIEASDTSSLIPQRVAGESGHLDLLDFYVRSGERMISQRTDWRWEADGFGMADFGESS